MVIMGLSVRLGCLQRPREEAVPWVRGTAPCWLYGPTPEHPDFVTLHSADHDHRAQPREQAGSVESWQDVEQSGQVGGDGGPEDVEIDVEVVVH